MNRYSYKGPVMFFDQHIGNYSGETIAASEKKARSNFIFQCKKQNKMMPTARINLPGKIKLIEENVYM